MTNEVDIYKPLEGYHLCDATIHNERKQFIAKSVEIANGVVTFSDVKFMYLVVRTIRPIPSLKGNLGINCGYGSYFKKDYPQDFYDVWDNNRCVEKKTCIESFSTIDKITVNIDNFHDMTQCNEETIKGLCPWGFLEQSDALQIANDNMIAINENVKKENNILLDELYDNILPMKLKIVNQEYRNEYWDTLDKWRALKKNYDHSWLGIVKLFKKFNIEKPIKKVTTIEDISLTNEEQTRIKSYIEDIKTDDTFDIVDGEIKE